MPPVRTKKKNNAPTGLAALGFTRDDATVASPRVRKPVTSTSNGIAAASDVADLPVPKAASLKVPAAKASPKGEKEAWFEDSRRDWDGKYEKVLGTATRKLTFGRAFKLSE